MSHVTHNDDDALFEVIFEAAPSARQSSRLSPREYAVLELSACGSSSKETGALLAISAETSRGALARTIKKLDLKSAGLVPLFWTALASPPTKALDCAGRYQRLVFEHKLAQLALDGLSERESQLARALILGRSNQEIALQRGSSIHTIANQLHALFRKLRVTSRGELAALMLGTRPRTH